MPSSNEKKKLDHSRDANYKRLVHSADVIAAQIEVSQRCALPQHSCKTFCPACAYLIPAAIEVSERCALPQHSEIEVTQPL